MTRMDGGPSAEDLAARDPGQVFDDHLRLADEGDIEDDLARNYAADVVVLTGERVHHGHRGTRELAALLQQELPGATFRYTARIVAGEVALLEWSATSPSGARVDDGADSFLIRDGLIRAQTIHYTVQLPGGRSRPV